MPGAKWRHLIAEGKMSVVTLIESRVKIVIGIVWLRDTYDIGELIMVFLEVKCMGSPQNSYSIPKSGRVQGQINKSLTWITEANLNYSQTWASLQIQNPWMKGNRGFLEEGPSMLPKIHTVNLSPSFPQRQGLLPRWLVNWEKEIIRIFRGYWTEALNWH